jgi:hypothetical protein
VFSEAVTSRLDASDQQRVGNEVSAIFKQNGINVTIHILNEVQGRAKNIIAGDDYGVVVDINNSYATPGLSTPLSSPYLSNYHYQDNLFPTLGFAYKDDLASYVLFSQPFNSTKLNDERALTVANYPYTYGGVNNSSQITDVSHTAAHEIAHQMLNRAMTFYKKTPQSLGLDEGLHYEGKPNLLKGSSGSDGHNNLIKEHIQLIKQYHAR